MNHEGSAMHQLGHDSPNSQRRGPDWSRVNQWLLWLGLAAAVTWLVARHGAHLLEVSPFLFLFACPLMHLFGHGGHVGHGGHGGHGNTAGPGQDRATPPPPPVAKHCDISNAVS